MDFWSTRKFTATNSRCCSLTGSFLCFSIKQFCRTAQLRFEKSIDFDTKRQFFLDYLEKVVYFEDQIAIHGSVPIEQGADGEEQGRIEFKIPGKITKAERKARYMKYRSGYEQITLPQFNGFNK